MATTIIESLESRVLLSGTAPSVAAFDAQAKVITQDINALKHGDASALKTLKADVKIAGTIKANKAALATFSAGDAGAMKTLAKENSAGSKLLSKDINRIVAAEKKLAKHPTDATLQTTLSDAGSQFTTDANTILNEALADISALTSTDTANLAALANSNMDNGQLQGDIGAAEMNQGTETDQEQTDVTTLLTTDVMDVTADFAPAPNQ